MFELLKIWAGAMVRAWKKMIRLPLPLKLEKFAAANGGSREAAAFVLTGWLCGVIAAFAGGTAALFFNRIGGSLLFALLVFLLFLWHDGGRGDGKLVSLISRGLPGDNGVLLTALPVFLMVMKFALLMGVFHWGGGMFAALIIGGAFALEAYLLGSLDVTPPVLDFSPKALLRFRIMLALVLICGFFNSGIAAALSALIFVMLCKSGNEKMLQEGVGADDIRAYSSLFVWLSLICRVITV